MTLEVFTSHTHTPPPMASRVPDPLKAKEAQEEYARGAKALATSAFKWSADHLTAEPHFKAAGACARGVWTACRRPRAGAVGHALGALSGCSLARCVTPACLPLTPHTGRLFKQAGQFDAALEALRKAAHCSAKLGNLKQVREGGGAGGTRAQAPAGPRQAGGGPRGGGF